MWSAELCADQLQLACKDADRALVVHEPLTHPIKTYRSERKQQKFVKDDAQPQRKNFEEYCEKRDRSWKPTLEEYLLIQTHEQLQDEALRKRSSLYLTPQGLEWVHYTNKEQNALYGEQGYLFYSPCLSRDEVTNVYSCGGYGSEVIDELKRRIQPVIRAYIVENIEEWQGCLG